MIREVSCELIGKMSVIMVAFSETSNYHPVAWATTGGTVWNSMDIPPLLSSKVLLSNCCNGGNPNVGERQKCQPVTHDSKASSTQWLKIACRTAACLGMFGMVGGAASHSVGEE
jgi:hypothetical protein